MRPFADKQVELVQNFAAQAVIAIENTRLLNELRESLDRQTATSEVLRVISSSPGELKPVFDAVVSNAMRICGAKFGTLLLFDGSAMRVVSMHNAPRALEEMRRDNPVIPLEKSILGPVVRTKRISHVADITAEEPYANSPLAKVGGARTALGVPMLREEELVGAIAIYRQEVRPFTDKQVALVETFAAQAVIAIENARLLNELRQRTDDLTESLEQQTATSEVLKVISSSPGELEPVFNAMLDNATRICEAKFGSMLRFENGAVQFVARVRVPEQFFAFLQRSGLLPGPLHPFSRLVESGRTIHIADYSADPSYLDRDPCRVCRVELGGIANLLVVPMLKDDGLIGGIAIYRQEVRPFTDKQIALVQNFANQAVIAIENTRLLNELRESLQQQTATADVLKVISSSPGELEPVFQAMLASAVRICDAKFGVLFRYDNEAFDPGALFGVPPVACQVSPQQRGSFQPEAGTPLERLLRTKDVVRIADNSLEPTLGASAKFGGARSLIAVPMLKENMLIGAINIYRQEVRPFTDKQIALVRNFAAQAVIAIDNTRLLNELREALEQQTATSEVLRVISSSPAELEPVFETLLENAVRICGAKFGILFLPEGIPRTASFHMHGAPPAFAEARRREPVIRLNPTTTLGRVGGDEAGSSGRRHPG